MKAETLSRLYNIGLFHRTIVNSSDDRIIAVDLDDKYTLLTLSDLEKILTENKDRLAITLAREQPTKVNRVRQPYAHLIAQETECPNLKLA